MILDFLVSFAGAFFGVVASFMAIGHFTKLPNIQALSPDLLERVEKAKRKYNIPEFIRLDDDEEADGNIPDNELNIIPY